MYKTLDVRCEGCGDIHIEYVDVPSGTALPDIVTCTVCGQEARRLLSFNIAKQQIAERTHGGELINGKLVSREAGMGAVKEQAALTRKLRQARKAKNPEAARDVQKELQAKQAEAVKKL